ncbi:MAG: hypothetical protein HFG28_05795 [Eubacterium sp.]|nr:hypothetical protein [Eubacterium sp.]
MRQYVLKNNGNCRVYTASLDACKNGGVRMEINEFKRKAKILLKLNHPQLNGNVMHG